MSHICYVIRRELTNMLKTFKGLVILTINFTVVLYTKNAVHATDTDATFDSHFREGILGAKCYHSTLINKIHHEAKYGNWWDCSSSSDEEACVLQDYDYCYHCDKKGSANYSAHLTSLMSKMKKVKLENKRHPKVSTPLSPVRLSDDEGINLPVTNNSDAPQYLQNPRVSTPLSPVRLSDDVDDISLED